VITFNTKHTSFSHGILTILNFPDNTRIHFSTQRFFFFRFLSEIISYFASEGDINMVSFEDKRIPYQFDQGNCKQRHMEVFGME